MLREWRDGDFVISRTNAPLVPLAIMALVQGHAVLALGLGDITKFLRTAVRGAESVARGWRTVEEFRAAAAKWGLEEEARIVERERFKRERYSRGRSMRDLDELIADLPEVKTTQLAVQAVLAMTKSATSVQEIEAQIDAVNVRVQPDSGPPKGIMDGKLVFTTVHKIKGAETNRVWILDDTFTFRGEVNDGVPVLHVPGDRHLTSGAAQEEVNLWYVAITRPKNIRPDARRGTPGVPGELFFVGDLKTVLGGGYVEDEKPA